MGELLQRHKIVVSIGRYPPATTDMKDCLVVADWEIEYAALFCKSIGTGILHARGTVVMLVEVKVKYLVIQTAIFWYRLLDEVDHIKIIQHLYREDICGKATVHILIGIFHAAKVHFILLNLPCHEGV